MAVKQGVRLGSWPLPWNLTLKLVVPGYHIKLNRNSV